jgi:hypothetical protein
MDRVIRYHESIKKFIKNWNYLAVLKNEFVKNEILKFIDTSDCLPSIVMLTIMNSQTKKNKLSIIGYYIAASIEFCYLIYKLTDKYTFYIAKYGFNNYHQIINNLILCSNLAINQNIESIKLLLNDDKILEIYLFATKNLNEIIFEIINEYKFIYNKCETHFDLLKCTYLDYDQLIVSKKLEFLNCIDKENMFSYINNKIGNIYKLSVNLGWLFGNGNSSLLPQIEKNAIYLSKIIKIYNDIENINNDFKFMNDHTTNYIINYGMYDTFNLFMLNKEKIIENLITHDIYTNTIKDIIKMVEDKIDFLVDKTPPDLQSEYT